SLTAASVVDFTGYERLRASAARNDPAALGEAAVQFEALVIGMLLESARAARLGDGLLDGDGTEQYLELMDRQVALELARAGGLGFADMIVRQLGGTPAGPRPHAAAVSFAPAVPFASGPRAPIGKPAATAPTVA